MLLVLYLLILSFYTSIFSSELDLKNPQIIEKSDPFPPSWRNAIPKPQNDIFFYVGTANHYLLQDAITDARMHAVRGIKEELGQKVSTNYERVREGDTIKIKDIMCSKGIPGILRGVRELQVYWERIKEKDKIYYRVWLLVSFPKKVNIGYVKSLEKEGDLANSRNDITRALNSYIDALECCQIASDNPEVASIAQNLASKIDNIAGNIEISLISGNNQSASLNKPLKDNIEIKISYNGKPLNNLVLHFNITAGDISVPMGVVTKSDGVAQIPVFKVNCKGQSILQICIVPEDLPYIRGASKNKSVNVIIEGISPQILVAIREISAGCIVDIAESMIEQKLQEKGNSIIAQNLNDEQEKNLLSLTGNSICEFAMQYKASQIIAGELKAEIISSEANIYFATVVGNMRLFDTSTGKVFAQLAISKEFIDKQDIKEGKKNWRVGRTKEEACRKCLEIIGKEAANELLNQMQTSIENK